MRQARSEKVATAEEVSEALEKLHPADWARLYAFAKNRVRVVGLYGSAVDAGDLMHDAVTALLEGRRTWDPKRVDFVGVLMGAMRSIASNCRERSLKSGRCVPESQVAFDSDGDGSGGLVGLCPDPRPDPERQLVLAEEQEATMRLVRELYDSFDGDAQAQLVMDGWREGLSAAAIREALEISTSAYETVARRIRRKSAAPRSKAGSHVD